MEAERLARNLHQAVEEEEAESVERWLRKNADPNLLLRRGLAAVHLASAKDTEGGVKCLKLILQHQGDPNLGTLEDLTPLHIAASWGCPKSLKLLLRNGADPNLQDQDGMKPEDLAEEQKNMKCVQILKEYQQLRVNQKPLDVTTKHQYIFCGRGNGSLHFFTDPTERKDIRISPLPRSNGGRSPVSHTPGRAFGDHRCEPDPSVDSNRTGVTERRPKHCVTNHRPRQSSLRENSPIWSQSRTGITQASRLNGHLDPSEAYLDCWTQPGTSLSLFDSSEDQTLDGLSTTEDQTPVNHESSLWDDETFLPLGIRTPEASTALLPGEQPPPSLPAQRESPANADLSVERREWFGGGGLAGQGEWLSELECTTSLSMYPSLVPPEPGHGGRPHPQLWAKPPEEEGRLKPTGRDRTLGDNSSATLSDLDKTLESLLLFDNTYVKGSEANALTVGGEGSHMPVVDSRLSSTCYCSGSDSELYASAAEGWVDMGCGQATSLPGTNPRFPGDSSRAVAERLSGPRERGSQSAASHSRPAITQAVPPPPDPSTRSPGACEDNARPPPVNSQPGGSYNPRPSPRLGQIAGGNEARLRLKSPAEIPSGWGEAEEPAARIPPGEGWWAADCARDSVLDTLPTESLHKPRQERAPSMADHDQGDDDEEETRDQSLLWKNLMGSTKKSSPPTAGGLHLSPDAGLSARGGEPEKIPVGIPGGEPSSRDGVGSVLTAHLKSMILVDNKRTQSQHELSSSSSSSSLVAARSKKHQGKATSPSANDSSLFDEPLANPTRVRRVRSPPRPVGGEGQRQRLWAAPETEFREDAGSVTGQTAERGRGSGREGEGDDETLLSPSASDLEGSCPDTVPVLADCRPVTVRSPCGGDGLQIPIPPIHPQHHHHHHSNPQGNSQWEDTWLTEIGDEEVEVGGGREREGEVGDRSLVCLPSGRGSAQDGRQERVGEEEEGAENVLESDGPEWEDSLLGPGLSRPPGDPDSRWASEEKRVCRITNPGVCPASGSEESLPADTILDCRYLGARSQGPSSPKGEGEDGRSSPTDLLSNSRLLLRLRDIGDNPGPITDLTRNVYLHRLHRLLKEPRNLQRSEKKTKFSPELCRSLEIFVIPDCRQDELTLSQQFDRPDRSRRWREGLVKSSFNYLLLDPRVTMNLPARAQALSAAECFRVFVHGIFYVGKGKRSRPYSHLNEAQKHFNNGRGQVSSKLQRIMDIWAGDLGVISLHCFQNVIAVEAFTREACMVDALGLPMLTNQKRGDYYGAVATWAMKRRRQLGVHLLRQASLIFLAEGERQLRPADI